MNPKMRTALILWGLSYSFDIFLQILLGLNLTLEWMYIMQWISLAFGLVYGLAVIRLAGGDR